MADRVRVLVVDDSAGTRTMLREALSLEGGLDVVGEAGSGAEAIERTRELSPDVILMDVRMPGVDGVHAARAIMRDHPGTKIVALTWSDDPATVREMLAAGAIGYVVKGGTIEELYTAIHRAATGEAELDQRVLPAAVEDLRRLLEQERERRQQVERLAKSKEEFVQILSHELRTPLTIIAGALRMVGAKAQREEAQIVESALRRLGHLEFLVEGLELLGADSARQGRAYPDQAVRSAAERLGVQPDSLQVESGAWDGVSHACVSRVAFELMSNAARHGRRPIDVAASRNGKTATLVVTDAGGWSPPAEDFSAFFQEDMSATRTRGGFGLGLFLASRVCQACEGDLAITARDGRTVAEARFRLA